MERDPSRDSASEAESEGEELNENPVDETTEAGEPAIKAVSVFVKGFSSEVTEDNLKEEFSRFGTIVDTSIPRKRNGKPKGYVFVEFANKDDAEHAVEEMNDTEWMGGKLTVQLSTGKKNAKKSSEKSGSSRRSSSSSRDDRRRRDDDRRSGDRRRHRDDDRRDDDRRRRDERRHRDERRSRRHRYDDDYSDYGSRRHYRRHSRRYRDYDSYDSPPPRRSSHRRNDSYSD